MDMNNYYEEEKLKQQMRERYDEEERNFKEITITDLICEKCKYVYHEPQLISICEKYPKMKPGKVLYGKGCNEYIEI